MAGMARREGGKDRERERGVVCLCARDGESNRRELDCQRQAQAMALTKIAQGEKKPPVAHINLSMMS